MFSKLFALAALVLATSLQVNAHAGVSPVLGLSTAPVRSDVKRPNAAKPCGRNVDIAGTLDTSTPVQAAADGTFTMTATNFNRRVDGSRKFSALVDTTATGDNMKTKVTMVQNGDPAPAQLGSEQIVAQLPAGTTCTGGAAKNLCLVQFKSVSGFGNCVVVQQGGAAAAGTASNTTASGTASNATASDTTGTADASATDATDASATDATDASATDATDASATDATDASATDAAPAAATPAAAATGAQTAKKGKLAKLFQRDNVGGTRVARRLLEAMDLLESREFDDTEIMDLVGREMWDLMMEFE